MARRSPILLRLERDPFEHEIRTRLSRERGPKDGGSTDVGDMVVMAFWDGADGTYEETYAVHTAATLQEAAGPKLALTAEAIAAAQAAWERKQLFGPADSDNEPAGGEMTLWHQELTNDRWW